MKHARHVRRRDLGERPGRWVSYDEGNPKTPHTKSSERQQSKPSGSQQSEPSKPQQASQRGTSEQQISRKATDHDAKKYGFKPGFKLDRWDPTEEPIRCYDALFDANQLGEMMHNLTVDTYGEDDPEVEMASDLMLLIVQLHGYKKTLDGINGYMKSVKALMDKFEDLIGECDDSIGIDERNLAECLFGDKDRLAKLERFKEATQVWIDDFKACISNTYLEHRYQDSMLEGKDLKSSK